MKEKCLLFYYFTEGAFHANATDFILTNLKQKLEKYLSKNSYKSENLDYLVELFR